MPAAASTLAGAGAAHTPAPKPGSQHCVPAAAPKRFQATSIELLSTPAHHQPVETPPLPKPLPPPPPPLLPLPLLPPQLLLLES